MDPKNTNPASQGGQNQGQGPQTPPQSKPMTPPPAQQVQQGQGAYPPPGAYPPGYPPQGSYPPPGAYPPGYPPQGAYPPPPGYPPMYDPYAPQGAYPPPGAYPPGGYAPQGAGYPPQGAYPQQMPPQGQMPAYPPMPPAEDTTPANFLLGTKFPPKLKVSAPKSELKYDDEYFIRLLAGSISLSKDEKKKIIESIPKLKQAQIDELIRIFEEEKQKFAALSKKHVPQLEKLAQQHFDEWMDLEHEWDLSQKKTEDSGKADAIRKSLGL